VDATLVERLGVDESAAGGEQRTSHHATLLFGPKLHIVVGALKRFVGRRRLAFAVDGPLGGEFVSFGDGTSTISRVEIIVGISVEIPAKTLDLVGVAGV